mmetsp:Transcript_3197/g.6699  ORF Transcript_3197/g.6699 Transcript_3197/m.6699 type:complete len:1762 (+) Transcript_3197:192-5477(+)
MKPTEAQLRFVGFQFKRQAVSFRTAVDQFWLTPAHVNDVEGAFSEDGNTTEESSHDGEDKNNNHRRRKTKPKISRGRRALLRVSRRKFDKRRAEIEKRGFIGEGGVGPNEDGNALEALFADESIQKRRRRRKRATRSAKDADRVKRFEAAFHTMMKNLEASKQPNHVIETPTRIWTRPDGAEPLESLDYSALKMGSQQKIHNHNPRFNNLPMDRGASWLIHMPKRMSNMHTHPSHNKNGGPPNKGDPTTPLSPVRQRLEQLTDFQYAKSPVPGKNDTTNAPTSKVTKYFAPTLEFGELDEVSYEEEREPLATGSNGKVRNRAAAFENRQQTEEQLATVLDSMDPDLIKEMEQLDPGVTDRLRALYLGDDSPRVPVKEIAKNIESPSLPAKEKRNGLVQKFVDSMEAAIRSKQEDLVAADGKLQKAAFARLVNQYLVETEGNRGSPQTPRAVSGSSIKVSMLADSFLNKINGDSKALIDSNGSFDKQAFEGLVTRYLSEAAGIDEDVVQNVEDLESLASMSQNDNFNAEDEHNNHVNSISRQLADDFNFVVEEYFASLTPSTTSEELGSGVEMIVQDFLIENCGVLPEEYAAEVSDPILSEVVLDLKSAAFFKLEHAQHDSYDETDFFDSITAHFIQFFEQSMEQERETTDEADHEPSEGHISLVQELIQCIQNASSVEPLVTVEGDLDTGTVTVLMKRYLAAASGQDDGGSFLRDAKSPLALAQARRAAGSTLGREDEAKHMNEPSGPIDENEASFFIARCIECLERNARGEVLVSEDGKVDEVKLGQILTASFDPRFFPLPNQGDLLEVPDSTVLDSHMKVKTPSVVSELTLGSARPNGVRLHSTENNKPVGKLVSSVKKSFGGFVRRLYTNEDGSTSSEMKADEMKAYSSFRKSRQVQRDDTSSQTSFLPQGIRSVVKKLGGAVASQADRGDEENVDDNAIDSCYSATNNELYSPSQSSPRKGEKLSNLMVATQDGIIDTDGSEPSEVMLEHERLKNLTLSPAVVTKRFRQAQRCVEKRQWKEVQYLLSANPWLAEMADANSKQYLLHKLALFGAGEGIVDRNGSTDKKGAAPLSINTNLVRLFPSSVHKFDREGNLPLHMACASINVTMAQLLGDKFPSGATVRNDDGLLPVHLAILACASPLTKGYGNADAAGEMVRTMLGYFPGAVAVGDGEGNLPLHTASTVLRGDVGVDVIYMLFDEAERQLKDPMGARFRNKIKIEDLENMSMGTDTTETPTDSSNAFNDALQCTLVRNDVGETPLLCAIHTCAGWEVVDALVQGPGGKKAALTTDEDGNNALHLLLHETYQDPTSALSILKVAPESASVRNNDGMLPIEMACMQYLPIELIMALLLVDLPIDIDNKDRPERREGFGESWWFIACECDDHYFELVDEIVSICSVSQVRELAYMKNSAGESLIELAAPESREVLQCALRYLGRFEIRSELPLGDSAPAGMSIFQAVDFGYSEDGLDEGIDVYLKFFPNRSQYDAETNQVRELEFDFDFVEEVFAFDTSDMGDELDNSKQFCLCIEQPQLTLAGVVSGMMRNEDCQNDTETRRRYAKKALAVMRAIAKALVHLHSLNVLHGNLNVDCVGKYDSKWKLAGMAGLQRIGDKLIPAKFSYSVPPEAISQHRIPGTSEHKASFRSDLTASTSVDIWGFGYLGVQVLTGKPIVPWDVTKEIEFDHSSLMDIMHWNDFNLETVRQDLMNVAVPQPLIQLIVGCLHPDPSQRPSAHDLLENVAWREIRSTNKSNSPGSSNRG